MELLKRLQDWYQLHCDGDWEHSYGVIIDTLDNPGWKLSVDLTDTLLEDVDFQPVNIGDPENKNNFWIDCKKERNVFVGMGCVDSLEKLLSVFLDWSDCNSDTSKWDATVNSMIEQCTKCYDLEQLRQLYNDIDSIPTEHTRRSELIRLFDERWTFLINNS